jgi:hypothetical protein
MKAMRGRPRILCLSATMAFAALVSSGVTAANQQAAPPPPPGQALKGVAIRGCLVGTKLTHIDQPDSAPALPTVLTVTSIRVIRDQVKGLDGHYVEVIGALRNVPGQETGLLVAESDKGKFYIGGGDPRLGEDLRVSSSRPPTVHAHTIRDLAAACPAQPPQPR